MYVHFLSREEDRFPYGLDTASVIVVFPCYYNDAVLLARLQELIQIEHELLHPKLRYRVKQYHAPPRLVYEEDVNGIPSGELYRLRCLTIELIHIWEEYHLHWNHPDWEVLSREIESICTQYA